MEIVLIILILAAGLYMSWSIGANDVANAMGTSVGSGALTLKQAVIIAAILEFAGAFFFGSHVSKTVQSGIINADIFAPNPMVLVYGMLSALIAAGAWLQLASYYGWPVSTTHTIVGSLVGFGFIVGGVSAIYWDHVGFIISSWILSPILGGILGYYLFTLLRKRVFYNADPITAAKKLTPILVFFVFLVLVTILIFEGVDNLHWNISLTEKTIIIIAIAGLASLISYFSVKRIEHSPNESSLSPVYGPDVITALEKASKHLKRVQAVTSGEIQYHAAFLMQEVEDLSHSIQKTAEVEITHVEYQKVEQIFGYLQIMSACLMAFAHGANDVANAIGPLSASISILMTGSIAVSNAVPTWALALGGFGIVVGLATWGWRVIETIGKKITELTPTRGFAAEFGAATTIVLASRLGLPISTTHTLVGAVIGVGFARGIGALNLATTRDIAISWIVTVPAGACLTIIIFYFINLLFGNGIGSYI